MFRKLFLFLALMCSGINLLHCMMENVDLENPAVVTVSPEVDYTTLSLAQLGDHYYEASTQTLKLNNMNLTWRDFAKMLPVIQNFGSSRTITNIDLRNNNLTAEGLPVLVFIHMIHDQYLKKVIVENNPMCEQGLGELIEGLVSLLNNKGPVRRFFEYVLSGIIKFGKERYEVELGNEDSESDFSNVLIDAGEYKYSLKKIVDHIPSTILQKFSPLISKLTVAGLTALTTYLGVEGFLIFTASTDECDLDALNQMLSLCNFTCS